MDVGRGVLLHPAAGHEVGVQVVGEVPEAGQDLLVAAHQGVVAEHRRDRHRQAAGGHHQGFAHRAGDLVEGRLAGGADADEGVVDAPHGAEEADEGCRATHRGEDRQARLQAAGGVVDGLAQGAGEPVVEAQHAVQLVPVVGVVADRLGAAFGQVAEGVVAGGGEGRHAGLEAGGVPELLGAAAHAAQLHEAPGLHEDHRPGGQRHEGEHDGDGMGDAIALGPDLGKAEGGFGHGGFP